MDTLTQLFLFLVLVAVVVGIYFRVSNRHKIKAPEVPTNPGRRDTDQRNTDTQP